MKKYSYFFVGTNTKPSFLVEINKNKKQLQIYKMDKYSKNEEFFEKYSLGSLVLNIKYKNFIFSKNPVVYKKKYLFVPEIIFKIKDNFLTISTKIKIAKN